jgi:hypothetical protein
VESQHKPKQTHLSHVVIRIHGGSIQGTGFKAKRDAVSRRDLVQEKKIRANSAQLNRSANHVLPQEKKRGKGIDPSSN